MIIKMDRLCLRIKNGKKIKLITIIGEIEGHDNLPAARQDNQV